MNYSPCNAPSDKQNEQFALSELFILKLTEKYPGTQKMLEMAMMRKLCEFVATSRSSHNKDPLNINNINELRRIPSSSLAIFRDQFFCALGKLLAKTANGSKSNEEIVAFHVKIIAGFSQERMDKFVDQVMQHEKKDTEAIRTSLAEMRMRVMGCDASNCNYFNPDLLGTAESHPNLRSPFLTNKDRIINDAFPPAVAIPCHADAGTLYADSAFNTAALIDGISSSEIPKYQVPRLLDITMKHTRSLADFYTRVISPEVRARFPHDRSIKFGFTINPETGAGIFFPQLEESQDTGMSTENTCLQMYLSMVSEAVLVETTCEPATKRKKSQQSKTPSTKAFLDGIKNIPELTSQPRQTDPAETFGPVKNQRLIEQIKALGDALPKNALQIRLSEQRLTEEEEKEFDNIVEWIKEKAPQSSYARVLDQATTQQVELVEQTEAGSAEYLIFYETSSGQKSIMRLNVQKQEGTVVSATTELFEATKKIKPGQTYSVRPQAQFSITKTEDQDTYAICDDLHPYITKLRGIIRTQLASNPTWRRFCAEKSVTKEQEDYFVYHVIRATIDALHFLYGTEVTDQTEEECVNFLNGFSLADCYGSSIDDFNERHGETAQLEKINDYLLDTVKYSHPDHELTSTATCTAIENVNEKEKKTGSKTKSIPQQHIAGTPLARLQENIRSPFSALGLPYHLMFSNERTKELAFARLLSSAVTGEQIQAEINAVQDTDDEKLHETMVDERLLERLLILPVDSTYDRVLTAIKAYGIPRLKAVCETNEGIKAHMKVLVDQALTSGYTDVVKYLKSSADYTEKSNVSVLFHTAKLLGLNPNQDPFDKTTAQIKNYVEREPKHSARYKFWMEGEQNAAELINTDTKARRAVSRGHDVPTKSDELSVWQEQLRLIMHLKSVFSATENKDETEQFYAQHGKALELFLNDRKAAASYVQKLSDKGLLDSSKTIRDFWIKRLSLLNQIHFKSAFARTAPSIIPAAIDLSGRLASTASHAQNNIYQELGNTYQVCAGFIEENEEIFASLGLLDEVKKRMRKDKNESVSTSDSNTQSFANEALKTYPKIEAMIRIFFQVKMLDTFFKKATAAKKEIAKSKLQFLEGILPNA